MSPLSNQTVSNQTVPNQIEPMLRHDLEWSAHGSQAHWVARDPLTAGFFSFNEMERTAAGLMTGKSNISQLLQQLCRLYPTAGIDRNWLMSLVAKLRQHHLLAPLDLQDGQRLFVAGRLRRKRGTLQFLMSPLAVRVPLGNPTFLLHNLRRPASILFHPLMVAVWMIAGAGVLFLVLRQFLSGHVALSVDLQSIQGDRWLLLFLCYLAAKSLHELGHALACVRNNTECNEVGVMFLCFAPCFYCDTTDSWKLSSKWQRAGIAAAGMYVELILATLAALVWLLTKDGTVHFVAASVMVVCSLGTIFINSNPLLKYDGYYILSDLWGVPNLADQSREAFRALLRYLISGVWTAKNSLDANIFVLALYAVCSTVYRVIVLSVILWVVWLALLPRGLGFLAMGLTLIMLVGILLGQYRSLSNLLRGASFTWVRLTLGLGAMLGMGLLLVEVPIPSYVRARAVGDYQDKLPLFASQTAEIVYVAPAGIAMQAGSPLIELASPESELELLSVRGDLRLVEQELEQLRLQQTYDPAASYLIPVKTQTHAELRAREELLQREIASLKTVAPHNGFLLFASSNLPQGPTERHDDRYSRNVLLPTHLGCVVERSELLGWFSSKQAPTLTAIVDQDQVKLLRLGMQARIQWDGDVSTTSLGRVTRISPTELAETPPELVGDPTLISSRNSRGIFCPDAPHYAVTLALSNSNPNASERPRGAPATIQISVASKTLIAMLTEIIQRNIKPLY